ncbi:MAG: tRNA lysidine(34) synthetase TilS [Planctomycetes bacterium]|nr:tRNA lysidine(34) synthetase TilS [Planctomycetota bacterium]
MNLAAHVAGCLHRHGFDQSAGVVAVSGGPDSVALAHLCAGLLTEGRISRLILAHVNHQLRGDESDADEAFVRNLPADWQLAGEPGLRCVTRRIDVTAIADAERANLESVARRERYRWFTELARTENAAWIAAGHTADDQAETVLFRLLRGSGVLGLGGMPECRTLGGPVCLVRPLLSVRRQVLVDYLQERRLAYRIDSSNTDRRFTRNRLRLDLLPLLEEQYNPAIVDVLCRLAEQSQALHADETSRASELLRQAELPRAGDMLVLSAAILEKAPVNQVREMFRLIWQRENWPLGDMDYDRWHRLAEMALGASPACDFPGGVHVARVGRVVQIRWRVRA